MVARSGMFVAPLAGSPPIGMSPTDGRIAFSALIGTTAQLASGGAVTQSASIMAITVAPAVWQLPDVSNATGTSTFLSATDQFTVTPAAGPATGSRVDLIVVKQNNVENSDADSRVNVVLVAGTAGAPGVAPAVPTGAYLYATVNVPATVTNSAACTIVIPRPTTFAPLPIKSTTFALLNTVTGVNGQHATVTADASPANNIDWVWLGAGPWQPASGPFPGGSVIRTGTAGSFGAGVWTYVGATALWAVDQPTQGITVANGQFTATLAGLYDVEGGIQLDSSVGLWLAIKKNDTGASGTGAIAGTTVSGFAGTTSATLRRRVRLAVGDTVGMGLYVTSAAQWSNSNLPGSFFGIRYVEPLR